MPTILEAQNFNLMRYNEDYSRLKDSSVTFYGKIKYIPISQEGTAYLSIGVEVRQELDYAHHEDWGDSGVGSDLFILQRYHLHSDLHLSNRIRFFFANYEFFQNDDFCYYHWIVYRHLSTFFSFQLNNFVSYI